MAAWGYSAAEKQSWALNPGSRARLTSHRCRLVCTPLTPAPAPQEKQDKAVLQSEVASLRQNNQRLQEESQVASEQLRKFAEIFCRERRNSEVEAGRLGGVGSCPSPRPGPWWRDQDTAAQAPPPFQGQGRLGASSGT